MKWNEASERDYEYSQPWWILLGAVFCHCLPAAPRPCLSNWCMAPLISCITAVASTHKVPLQSATVLTPLSVKWGLQQLCVLWRHCFPTAGKMQIFFPGTPTVPFWLSNVAQDSSSLCGLHDRSTCSKNVNTTIKILSNIT